MLAFSLLFFLFYLSAIALEVEITQIISVQENKLVTHRVTVGAEGEYLFQPGHINADVGDKVVFEFRALNHTLTQSSLNHPCTSTQQLDSGFKQFNPTDRDDLTLSLTVNTLEPQWLFCRQSIPFSHCHAGMVFAINPGDHMEEFLANVKRESAVNIPDVVVITSQPPASTGVFPTGVFPTGVFPTGVFPTGVFPTGMFPTGAMWHSTGTSGRSVPSPSQPPPEAFTSSGNNTPLTAALFVFLFTWLACQFLS
ncbi:hypothetical protein EMCG_04726 [[Emmonsia] crescens]|uniref:Phytocyanin domain-containing protein n=1 Tax=[Emmonsia] crescens TaxID=73230 RepID=A0A0G2J749_9EURO|nr:hypothetical protein EMCG_04726 [Emmonsia crescens UAMH 3008]